jgi:membrane-associated phospholipid phosphatase
MRRLGLRRNLTSTFALAGALAGTLACIAPNQILAQSPDSAKSSKTVVRARDFALLGGGFALAGVTSVFDRHLAFEVRKPGNTRVQFGNLSAPGSTIGQVGPIGFSLALYAAGRVAHQAEWTTLGREATEAWLVGGVAVTLIKGVVGRARPYGSPNDPDLFRPGRGYSNNAFASFPSGHTTCAFAVASVLARGTAKDRPWVHRTVTVLAYAAATSVGLSRMYHNDHWLSDVVGGTALGMTSATVAMRFDDSRR